MGKDTQLRIISGWSLEEQRTLLELVRDTQPNYTRYDSKRKKLVHQILVEDLKEKGYTRDEKQVHGKLKKLNYKYQESLKNNAKLPQFHSLFESVFGSSNVKVEKLIKKEKDIKKGKFKIAQEVKTS